MKIEVSYIDNKQILEHEHVRKKEVSKLKARLAKGKFIPIVVTRVAGKKKYVVLDGHHRLNALRALGFGKIPCIVVDYNDVRLGHWRKRYRHIRKRDVIAWALEGKKFPHKTTRHKFGFKQSDYVVYLKKSAKS